MSASNADRSENYLVCPFSLFDLKKQHVIFKKNTYLAFSIIFSQRFLFTNKALDLPVSLKTLEFLFKGFRRFIFVLKEKNNLVTICISFKSALGEYSRKIFHKISAMVN